MKTDYNRLWRKITSIITLAGMSLLVPVPSPAKEIINPNPSIFNEPPYNRGKKTPQTIPTKEPASETTPVNTPTNTQVSPATNPTETTPVNTPTNTLTNTPTNTQVSPATNPTETTPVNTLTNTPTNTQVSPATNPTGTTPAVMETEEKRNLILVLEKSKIVLDNSNSQGSFKILITALELSGLKDVLQGTGPFTIFAPTDEAFNKIPKDALADLLKPENKEVLLKILTYHVVSQKVLAQELTKEIKSLQGDPISIKVNGDVIEVNDAKIIKSDVQGSNGVIHVIDNLILPPSL
ncbi:fasciclin domain-containing protein [Anabaena sp. FACHB-1237]|uniref:fasciclin domain-containing protein n=1 Tax=Anabaena sp. FACHB-1237 TaxID=2692769 RepID=UPI0016817213|nr:fasciclin domain-containing protein [Anabaena sp. FACHB-1237]MBD2138608.1 fasciclin domain-containing protein [Anabaena sp. FACHB-1237]